MEKIYFQNSLVKMNDQLSLKIPESFSELTDFMNQHVALGNQCNDLISYSY